MLETEQEKKTKEEMKTEEILEKEETKHEKNQTNVVLTEIPEEIDDTTKHTAETVTILEETQELQKEEAKPSKDHLHQYTKWIIVITILLFIAGGIFSTIFGLMHRNSNTMANGLSMKGIDISSLTKEEVAATFDAKMKIQQNKQIILKYGDFETIFMPEQIELDFKFTEAIHLAYGIGRTGNLLKDNYDIINTYLSHIEITPAYTYQEEALDNFLTSMQGNMPNLVKQSSYSIDGANLHLDKGQKGIQVNKEALKRQILDVCLDLNGENAVIEIPTVEKEPDPIDIAKIRNEIYQEAKDAYYTQNPFAVYPHINGVDLAISIEEAQNLIAQTKESTLTLPLNITTPKVTTNEIGTEAFPDLLATYSTTFSTSNRNRTTNIQLSSNKINGVVVMPGEEFSFNTVVGKRTAAAGYKSAGVYVNGRVENGIGGGICQVSSTLYNTVLRANLEIIKRSNHRFDTGYVPLSTDATVSWGGPEFIFKNSRKYPVKIVSTVNGGKITIRIYGCKEETEYEVAIQSQTLKRIPMKTVYRVNPSLPKGTKKTVQKGHGGYQSRAYRILKLNGNVVSKQLLSTDTYAQLETIIEHNP